MPSAHMAQSDELRGHLALLTDSVVEDDSEEVAVTPVFTKPVQELAVSLSKTAKRKLFTQYGLLAAVVDERSPARHSKRRGASQSQRDPRLFYNIAAPSSVFICGSQGSGKSHTLSCLLENCLFPSKANVLPRPLTGIVFHYDTFVSDSGGSPCEAAFLSSRAGVKVRVLCPPTNIRQIKRIYRDLPKVTVQELRLDESDLNTRRMLDLMAVSSSQGDRMPLYINVVIRLLRQLRLHQQAVGGNFDYTAFRTALQNEALTKDQLAPLEQRLETLESFMVGDQASRYRLDAKQQAKVKRTLTNVWTPKAGQLTIVDLSCPCITEQMACALFNICLGLFLEQESDIGRVVALDEAHKYMTGSSECEALTKSLLSTIRQQRHVAARIFISTQEPTISPDLLDLCSVTIVHRFTSPAWLQTLKKHLAGASELSRAEELANGQDNDVKSKTSHTLNGATPLDMKNSDVPQAVQLFAKIVALRTGEALLFAPSAFIGTKQPRSIQSAKRAVDKLTAATRKLQVSVVGDSQSASGSSDSDCSHSDASTYDGGDSSEDSSVASEAEPSFVRLGYGVLKVRIRQRVTTDGGKSIMAT